MKNKKPGFLRRTALSLAATFGASMFAINAVGCNATNAIDDFDRIVDADTKEKKGLWSIIVGSDALLKIPILPDPTHNFISILDHEEDSFLVIHGIGIDRKTKGPIRLPGNDEAIYAVINGDFILGYNYRSIFAGTEIAVLEPKDMLRKCMIMIDAMHCINQQNLMYDLFEIFGRGQNSNSVAYTLITAAGYEIPKENLGQIEEGHGRWLLSENWTSYYEDWELPDDSEEFMRWYIDEMRKALETATENMAESGPPPETRKKFFDPKHPFVPYKPLIIADALEKWAEKNQSHEKEALAVDNNTLDPN